MQFRHVAAAATILIGMAGLAGSAHAGKQDFTLFNDTGYQIDSVYVSAVNASSWEDDIMGKDSLADSEHVNISFEKGARGCHFDLKVKYNDGDTAEWHDLNLCDIEKVHLHWNKAEGVTTASTE